jgi:hypothetical protein
MFNALFRNIDSKLNFGQMIDAHAKLQIINIFIPSALFECPLPSCEYGIPEVRFGSATALVLVSETD